MQISRGLLEDAFSSLGRMIKQTRLNDIVQDQFTEELASYPNGSKIVCFSCNYTSKKNKTSAVVKFDMFRCHNCGLRRRVR